MTCRKLLTDLLLILLFAAGLWGGEYACRQLWEPDEARFAYVAREMQWDGHWAVPHRHGEPYAHKPPLLFWLIRGATEFTGGEVTQVSSRLPSFAGAVLTLWLTGLFALRWFGRAAFWPSILTLATTLIFWHEGGMGRMDALLCGLMLSAVYLLLSADERGGLWRRLLAYACMGLGILTKGPVGLIVPIGIYMCVSGISARSNPFRKAHLVWGIILTLLFPAVWLAAAWAEGAPQSYFQELLFKQNIGRLTGEGGFGKPRPFYYYLLEIPKDFMPWTVLAPACIAGLWRAGKRDIVKQIGAWLLFVTIFFSLSSGKRNIYIMSIYPALAILVAGGWMHAWDSARIWSVWGFRLLVAVLLCSGLCIIGFAFLPDVTLQIRQGETLADKAIQGLGMIQSLIFPPDCGLRCKLGIFMPAGLALIAATVFGAAWYRRRGWDIPLHVGMALLIAVGLALISSRIMPVFNSLKVPEEVIFIVQSRLEPDGVILIYGETQEITPFYCRRRGRSVTDPEELYAAIRKLGQGLIIFRKNDWLMFEKERRRWHAISSFRVGHKEMVMVSFGWRREAE